MISCSVPQIHKYYSFSLAPHFPLKERYILRPRIPPPQDDNPQVDIHRCGRTPSAPVSSTLSEMQSEAPFHPRPESSVASVIYVFPSSAPPNYNEFAEG